MIYVEEAYEKVYRIAYDESSKDSQLKRAKLITQIQEGLDLFFKEHEFVSFFCYQNFFL